MSLKVKLFSLTHKWSNLETIGLIIAKDNETYANLKLELEDTSIVELVVDVLGCGREIQD